MSKIRELNREAPSLDDVIPFASVSGDADRACTVSELAEVMRASTSEVEDMRVSPVTGGFVNMIPQVAGTSVVLLVTPGATLASLTIQLPGLPAHGQEVTVFSTNTVTALTVSGGDSLVRGAPTTIAADGHFRVRYDTINGFWFRVG